MTFLTLSDATAKFGAFWMYAVCSLVGWLFIYARLPETRGLTLEQIQDLFESNSCTPGLAKTRPHAPPFAPLPLNPFAHTHALAQRAPARLPTGTPAHHPHAMSDS